jgi:predicted lipoprotein with Yx(FWY)xxD motif
MNTPSRDARIVARRLASAAPIVAIAAFAAACGGGSHTVGSGYSPTRGAGSGHSAAASVAVASTELGAILVGESGRMLYLFEKDRPGESACGGACAAAWPIDRTSGTPTAGRGVRSALLGSIKRSDDTTQVTYNGHPLYYFAGDSRPGQINGEGVNSFGAVWYAVSPAGGKVESAGS